MLKPSLVRSPASPRILIYYDGTFMCAYIYIYVHTHTHTHKVYVLQSILPRKLMDMGFSFGNEILGTILNYKRDPYVHPQRSLVRLTLTVAHEGTIHHYRMGGGTVIG